MRHMGGSEASPSLVSSSRRATPALVGVVALGPGEGTRHERRRGPHRSGPAADGVSSARRRHQGTLRVSRTGAGRQEGGAVSEGRLQGGPHAEPHAL